MAVQRQPDIIDPTPHPFLTEFLDPAGYLTGVCPLCVTGFSSTPNGVGIRIARGSVPDQFFVAGPARDVSNRLKAALDMAENSLMAVLLRNDIVMLEDRLLKRLVELIPHSDAATVAKAVRDELEKMASGDSTTAGGKKVKGRDL
jgi:hypothetical protein